MLRLYVNQEEQARRVGDGGRTNMGMAELTVHGRAPIVH
jgi:hypothetical protein